MATNNIRGAEALLVSDIEAARRLGLGKTKVRELMGAGELATVRVGRRRLVVVASLERFVADRLAGAGR